MQIQNYPIDEKMGEQVTNQTIKHIKKPINGVHRPLVTTKR